MLNCGYFQFVRGTILKAHRQTYCPYPSLASKPDLLAYICIIQYCIEIKGTENFHSRPPADNDNDNAAGVLDSMWQVYFRIVAVIEHFGHIPASTILAYQHFFPILAYQHFFPYITWHTVPHLCIFPKELSMIHSLKKVEPFDLYPPQVQWPAPIGTWRVFNYAWTTMVAERNAKI